MRENKYVQKRRWNKKLEPYIECDTPDCRGGGRGGAIGVSTLPEKYPGRYCKRCTDRHYSEKLKQEGRSW